MKILALVLAGGEGVRLYPLTAEHAKPAVAFVNGCRIVDFVLGNLVNSKISAIYLLAQYKPQSLIEHIDTTWAHGFRGSGRIIKVVLPRSPPSSRPAAPRAGPSAAAENGIDVEGARKELQSK